MSMSIGEIIQSTDDEWASYVDALDWETSRNPFARDMTLDEFVIPDAAAVADISSAIRDYRGPIVVHSEYSGAGKTALVKALLDEYQEDGEYQTAYIGTHNTTAYELTGIVADRVLDVGKSSSTKLTERRLRETDIEDEVLLAVDEFGLNDAETIHSLQFLTDDVGVRLLLTGMTSQWEALQSLDAASGAFARRVALDVSLGPLDEDQLSEVLARRLATARGEDPDEVDVENISPFAESALSVLHRESQGVPGVAVSAAAEALSLAAYRHSQGGGVEVDAEIAEAVEYRDPAVDQ